MGKALLVARDTLADGLNTGEEFNLFGFRDGSAVESFTEYTATEGATFSNLKSNVVSGGSGTNNFQFRVNGANGNMLASVAGTGLAEDSVNTDTLSANDEFNIAYTDTGTASVSSYTAANVEFTSGHGNFHGCVVPNAAFVFDVPSATRFIPLNGIPTSDGNTTEAHAQFRNRGYTSIAAFQVNVPINARTTDSVFRDRINGSNGGFEITFSSLATGVVVDTTSATSLNSGDLICASMTLGTGIEDLQWSVVGATFKSTTNKSETWAQRGQGHSRTASGTAAYYPIGGAIGDAISNTEAQARITVGFPATVSNLRLYASGNTYTGDATLKLYQNGSAVMTTTITASTTGWFENTTDTITIDSDDQLSWELDEGTSGTLTIQSIGMTFSQVSGDASMAGESTAVLTGASIADSQVTAAGEAAATFVGDGGVISADATMGGEAAATMVGESTAEAPMTAAGEALVTFDSTLFTASTESGAVSMAGDSSAVMTGASDAEGAINSSGEAAALWRSPPVAVRVPAWIHGTSKERVLNPWKRKKRRSKLEVLRDSDAELIALLQFAIQSKKSASPH